jgi:hypothetical protein
LSNIVHVYPTTMPTEAGRYRSSLRRAAVAVIVGLIALPAAWYVAFLLAYGVEQGALPSLGAPAGTYLGDDLHGVVRTSLFTLMVALPAWGVVHNYGRRGPVAALLFALAAGVVGFKAVARDSGPLDSVSQFLAYCAPLLLVLLLMWRIAYRRPPAAQVLPLPSI